ncbi:type II secretion system F family protein [Vibrio paucivorans]
MELNFIITFMVLIWVFYELYEYKRTHRLLTKIDKENDKSLNVIDSNSLFLPKVGRYNRLKLSLFDGIHSFGLSTHIGLGLIIVLPVIVSLSIKAIWFSSFDIFWFIIIFTISFIWFCNFIVSKGRTFFLEGLENSLLIISQSVISGKSLIASILISSELSKNKSISKELFILFNDVDSGNDINYAISRAINRYMYKEYVFFLVNIRANVLYGGEIKPVINSISKTVSKNMTMEKRKLALTSEARISSKIVASIPILFFLFMRFFREDDYNFILNDSNGEWVLIYVLSSISIGLLVNYFLLKGSE